MRQSLYPKDRYPQGHPDLASSLNNLGACSGPRARTARRPFLLRQGTDMQQALARTLLAATSEAEAMSYLAQLPLTRDGLISVSLRVPASDEETYRRIWNGKSALTQILHDRQAAALGRAGTDPALQKTVAAWREARSRLARLILATADGRDHPERAAMIKAAGQREGAAGTRAGRGHARVRPQEGAGAEPPRRPAEVLPEGTAVLDLVRFTRFEQDPQVKGEKGERRTPGYVGFVLAKGQPVRMVDLGPAQPIETPFPGGGRPSSGQDSPAAADSAQAGLGAAGPPSPEGDDHGLPGPGRRPSAASPGLRCPATGPGRCSWSSTPWPPSRTRRSCSTVSPRRSLRPRQHRRTACWPSAAWPTSRKPKPVDDERTRLQLLAARPAETKRGGENGWTDLPGTLQELDAVSRLAASREILRLQGAEAGTARLLQELPRARWAHIATHGFFADPSIRSVLTPDPKLFARSAPSVSAPVCATRWSSRAWCWPGPTDPAAPTHWPMTTGAS